MSANTERPKTIEVSRVKRTRAQIAIAYDLGDEAHGVKSRDNPLPAFITALDALVPLVCTVLELPENYAQDLKVLGIIMDQQGGAPTVQIIAQKSLSQAGKLFPITTPARLLAHPSQEGSYTEPLSAKDRELIDEVIEQAKAYIKGERAQGQLPLAEDDEEDADAPDAPDEEEGSELPLSETSGKPVPRKKRSAVVAAGK